MRGNDDDLNFHVGDVKVRRKEIRVGIVCCPCLFY